MRAGRGGVRGGEAGLAFQAPTSQPDAAQKQRAASPSPSLSSFLFISTAPLLPARTCAAAAAKSVRKAATASASTPSLVRCPAATAEMLRSITPRSVGSHRLASPILR